MPAMRWLFPALAVAAAIAVSGCAIEGPPAPTQPANAVTLTKEKDGRFLVLSGPRLRHAEPFLGIASTNFYLLRSFIDARTGETVHQLYVEDSYPGAERNWNAARLAAGEPLRLVPISKNEITCDAGCSYAEEFAASLPEPLLRANPQGFTVVFSARSGIARTITVPGDLVAKQLAAIAQLRAAAPTAAAAGSAPAPPR
jgi:hypothetical protein